MVTNFGIGTLGPRPALGYIANRLDRAVTRRDDDAALKQDCEHPQAASYVIGGELVVLKPGEPCDPLFTLREARALGPVRETVFLGLAGAAPRFGVGLDPDAVERLKARNDLRVSDLRSIAVQGMVEADHLPPLAEAKALLGWHARHRFCPNCGAPTALSQAGWRRDCSSCRAEHFPRTDPVVIMLAIHGDRGLLGRNRRRAGARFSCLAGFVEPGETLEEAMRREVREESGIRCGRVRYLAAQPWPFPSSLMIGFLAEALTAEITVDPEELAEARWFHRDEIREMVARAASGADDPSRVSLPAPIAIAHHICRRWSNGLDRL